MRRHHHHDSEPGRFVLEPAEDEPGPARYASPGSVTAVRLRSAVTLVVLLVLVTAAAGAWWTWQTHHSPAGPETLAGRQGPDGAPLSGDEGAWHSREAHPTPATTAPSESIAPSPSETTSATAAVQTPATGQPRMQPGLPTSPTRPASPTGTTSPTGPASPTGAASPSPGWRAARAPEAEAVRAFLAATTEVDSDFVRRHVTGPARDEVRAAALEREHNGWQAHGHAGIRGRVLVRRTRTEELEAVACVDATGVHLRDSAGGRIGAAPAPSLHRFGLVPGEGTVLVNRHVPDPGDPEPGTSIPLECDATSPGTATQSSETKE